MTEYEFKSLKRELGRLRTMLWIPTTILLAWFLLWLRTNLR